MPTKNAAAKPETSKRPFVKAKSIANAKKSRDAKTGKVTMGTRSDLGQPGMVAIERMPEPHRSIARAADAAIRKAAPGATSVIKWGNAIYSRGGVSFALIYQTKKGINLGMTGVGLDDPEGLLEGTGKTMRHVKLHDVALAKSAAVGRLLKQAVVIGFGRM